MRCSPISFVLGPLSHVSSVATLRCKVHYISLLANICQVCSIVGCEGRRAGLCPFLPGTATCTLSCRLGRTLRLGRRGSCIALSTTSRLTKILGSSQDLRLETDELVGELGNLTRGDLRLGRHLITVIWIGV